MKVLVVHNFYQHPGGEDESFAAEVAMLKEYGHEVLQFTVHNRDLDQVPRLRIAANTVWNASIYRRLVSQLSRTPVDVAHFQNTFPQISPAGYYAANRLGIPVVQSLRNYRFSCVNGLFFRDGHPCEDCMGKLVPWPGIVHACYRDSGLASATVAAMITTHQAKRTFVNRVDGYIALSEFSRKKFVEAGLPANRVSVKPNFLAHDPGVGPGDGGFALFVGRLSPEKGIEALIAAWRACGKKIPLKIVGDGPLRSIMNSDSVTGVEWLGQRSQSEVLDLMGAASFLVFPSEWYETFGRVAIEAFAKGTPVLVSKIGAIAELIDHKRTGLHFAPGDVRDLVSKVEWILSNPRCLTAMRQAARQEFEAKYTARVNINILMEVYAAALENRRGKMARTRQGSGN